MVAGIFFIDRKNFTAMRKQGCAVCNRNVVENSAEGRTEEGEVAIMCVLADARVEGEASANGCKKYGQQFRILGNGDQGSQNHTSNMHGRKNAS
jgi:hypothetical protein